MVTAGGNGSAKAWPDSVRGCVGGVARGFAQKKTWSKQKDNDGCIWSKLGPVKGLWQGWQWAPWSLRHERTCCQPCHVLIGAHRRGCTRRGRARQADEGKGLGVTRQDDTPSTHTSKRAGSEGTTHITVDVVGELGHEWVAPLVRLDQSRGLDQARQHRVTVSLGASLGVHV
jgi:hypothetical protein